MPLAIEPLHSALGAAVTGIDLAAPMDAALRAELMAAWERHHVLVFRGQRIGDEAQVAFTRQFGDLEIFPQKDDQAAAVPEIFRVANTDEAGRILPPGGERALFSSTVQFWHTDSSYRPVPAKGAVLHGIDIPGEGGDTLWVNMFAVYEALPPQLQARIEGRKSRNSFVFMRTSCNLPPMKPEEEETVPPVEHALVRRHPDGRKSLYLSPVYVDSITGLNFEESRALVEELTEFATQPQFTYRHQWRKDDVVMWDNRCTMHRVLPYDSAHVRRIMHRTTLAGDSAFS